MLEIDQDDYGILWIYDAEKDELIGQVAVEDFLMWLDLMSLEQKGLIEVCARVNPELGPTIPVTLPNIT